MCGIIGYIGNKDASNILLNGLKRLEYRGYDSAGVALVDGDMTVIKKKGKIKELESLIDHKTLAGYTIGIGHTRWATHGDPSDRNSHPHINTENDVAIVHNGIIENFSSLKKKMLDYGYEFTSDTDSELLAHMIGYYHKHGNSLLDSVLLALRKVEGTYGLAVVSKKEPDKIIAARKGSPLVIGIGDNETVIASDVSAIVEHTRQVIYVEDGEIIEIGRDYYKTVDIDHNVVNKTVETIDWNIDEIEKSGFDHFMMKEIFEQVETIQNAYRGRALADEGSVKLGGLTLTNEELNDIERIIFIACGTSWHAGLIGEYLIEEYARIPVEVEYASEFRYRRPILKKTDLVIVVSQSGETADTLAALREAKAKGVKVMGVTNVVGSTIARESDGGVYIHAGPEIGVASTKAFTSQVTVLILITILLARRSEMTHNEAKEALRDLHMVPEIIEKILSQSEKIKEVALKYKDARNFLYLGRGIQFPVALEGALKLKEISYIHAEGYPAAEMKHGPIALIDENMPVVFIAPKDEVHAKVVTNMQEVRARGGRILTIGTEGDQDICNYSDDVIYVPPVNKLVSPLVTIIPLQLLSYYIAVARDCDVDQPRNLAKSVTVE